MKQKTIQKGRLTQSEKSFLELYYPVKGKAWCAKQLCRTVPSIRQHVTRMGLILSKDSDFFREFQKRAADGKVGKKRPEHSVFMKSLREKKPVEYTQDGLDRIGASARERIKQNGHPKGMLGKTHSEDNKKKMSMRVQALWADEKSKFNSDEYRQGVSDRMSKIMQMRIRTKGTIYSRSKNGWYIINGKRFYFRSGWEVVYARYLEWLVQKKEITKWQYEEDTFWFDKIKRGVRSYTPDFKVFSGDKFEYHEVKGYMDSKSKTKMNRMRIYHPEVKMVLIDKHSYKSILQFEKMFPSAIED